MENNFNIVNDKDYLEHHGILGQKWGRKNGPPYPLTPSDMSSTEKKAAGTAKASGSSNDTGNADKKSKKFPKSKTKEAYEKASKMSDKELDQAVNRLKKEKEYVDLHAKTITQGQNFVENLAIIAGTTLISTIATTAASKGGQAVVASILKDVTKPDVFKAIYPKK